MRFPFFTKAKVVKAVAQRRFGYISSGLLFAPERDSRGLLSAYGEIYSLFGIANRIATACGEVRWRLYKGFERGERNQVAEHPILKLLDYANEFQTGQEIIELTQLHMDLAGKAYWYLPKNGLGVPAEIWSIPPYLIQPVKSPTDFISGFVAQVGNEKIPFSKDEIIWFTMPDPLNPYGGVGFAQAAAIDLDTALYQGQWNRNFFYNSARPDGALETDRDLSDGQFKDLLEQWGGEHRGLSKSHKMAILEGGLKYRQIQISQKDMDFYSGSKQSRENLMFAAGMPLSVMGITENVNRANAEAGDYTFARWLIKPRLTRIKNKLNERLVSMFPLAKGLEVDFDEVVPETVEQKRLLSESGIRSATLTINESRKLLGFDPLPNGDQLLVPLNLIPTPVSGKFSKPSEVTIEEIPKGKGGEGSGNFGHEGRPGEVGGSGEGGGGASGQGWHDSLNDSEKGAVEGWSGSAGKVREYQRDGKGDAKTKKQTETLEAALNKDGNYVGKAYRGIDNISESQYNEILNSDTIELKALSSASMDKNVAFGFAKGKNNVVFEIDAKSGVDISGISKMPWEKEVILRKGAKYKVGKSRTEKLGNYTFTVLKMKEL